MKNIVRLFLLCLIFLIIHTPLEEGFQKNEHKIYGKVAWSPKELKKGLMYRKLSLSHNQGMLFPMKEHKVHTMWMKNTYIPLDILFLDKNFTVVGYIEDTKPLSTKSLSINKKSYYVLEVNGNTVSKNNISIGDKLNFVITKLT